MLGRPRNATPHIFGGHRRQAPAGSPHAVSDIFEHLRLRLGLSMKLLLLSNYRAAAKLLETSGEIPMGPQHGLKCCKESRQLLFSGGPSGMPVPQRSLPSLQVLTEMDVQLLRWDVTCMSEMRAVPKRHTRSLIHDEGRSTMLVQVHWTNNRYDYIEDFMLDTFIEAGVVSRFWRSYGWATVGVDPIRSGNPAGTYRGRERRSY